MSEFPFQRDLFFDPSHEESLADLWRCGDTNFPKKRQRVEGNLFLASRLATMPSETLSCPSSVYSSRDCLQ